MLPNRHGISILTAPWGNPECGSPPVYTNLTLWLCAESLKVSPGYVEGQTFTNWTDISPGGTNGVYYTNKDSAAYVAPLFHSSGQNGKAYVDVGDAGHSTPLVSSNAWFSGLTSGESFWVIHNSYILGLGWDWITSNTSSGYSRLTEGVTQNVWSSWGSTTYKDCNFGIYIVGGRFLIYDIYTANNDWAMYTNGVVAFSTNSSTVGWPATAKAGYLTQSAPNGTQMGGRLYEILVYTNKLSTSDRTAVNNWLKTKYGL